MTQQANGRERGHPRFSAMAIAWKIVLPAAIAAVIAATIGWYIGVALLQWSQAAGIVAVMGLPIALALVALLAVGRYLLSRNQHLLF